ncbi:hypothetical protein D5F01_LYC21570 [Larimichthys crocea]|uniref:PiggyBac transposable element-derived protein domain-containing protein n=1 Tax=Larimichthys crocea TaxID=215358 RepID=A0A6G0HP63_LARCR|nr:hypothetical protein D5F01_LYC21570 [Larimichthys crocea]
MQIYTGKKPNAAAGRGEEEEEGRKKGKGRGGSEKNQATCLVLNVTEDLTSRNITCDNFFTSYELAQRLLLEKNNTLLGTIRKNKPELPDALLTLRGRRILSSKFAFTRDTALVSYLAKKNKNVLRSHAGCANLSTGGSDGGCGGGGGVAPSSSSSLGGEPPDSTQVQAQAHRWIIMTTGPGHKLATGPCLHTQTACAKTLFPLRT